MIYRRSLFSPRRFHSSADPQDAHSSLPTKSTGDHPVNPLANGTEAILDSFAYLLSPGAVTVRKLQEIFEKVRTPEVRLCLRAHGQMRALLQCLQQVEDDPSMHLLRVGCWHCLSLDSFSATELLETCCESLMAAVDAPPRKIQEPDRPEESSSKATGTLKRRRGKEGGSTGADAHWEELHRHVAFCVQQEEPQLQMEPAGDSVRTISLLILWRCLGNFNAEASPKAVEKLWAWFPTALQQRLSSELLWQAFERLARTAPGGAAPLALSQVVEAARQTLSDVSLPAGCQHSCLRALHALVTFTREPLAPLFNDEMQQLLVARCHHLDLPGSSASVRSVLGILGNLASCSPSFCEELSGVGIVRPFSLALAKSLSWYKEQLSDESETLEVEVHLTYAMASLLLGWLARGSSMARDHLEDQLGSTQALLDILRTFTIFQDRCGILTDGSLLCVHTVMQFLAEADEAEQLQQASQAESREGKEEDLTSKCPKVSKTGNEHVNLRELTSDERANLLQVELTPEHGKIFRQMEMTPPCPKTSESKASWKEREPTPHHPKTSECEGALQETELTPPHPQTSKRKAAFREMELTPKNPKTSKRKASLTQMELTPPHPKPSKSKAALTQMELTPPHPKPSKSKAALTQMELTPPHSKISECKASLKEMELTPQHSKTSECNAPLKEMEQSFCTDVVQVYQRRRAKRREDDVNECGDFNPVPL